MFLIFYYNLCVFPSLKVGMDSHQLVMDNRPAVTRVDTEPLHHHQVSIFFLSWREMIFCRRDCVLGP